MLDVSDETIRLHLHKAGYVKKRDSWVPHELTERNRLDRYDACAALLQRSEREPFLRNLITGDEKWVLYNNVSPSSSWVLKGSAPQATAKAGLHPKKVMLSIWWDMKGVVFFELLEPNQTINTAKYCEQLDKLKEAVAVKRPELANR